MCTNRQSDAVDAILAQWARERPDLDCRPMGPVGRLKRCMMLMEPKVDAIVARYDLVRWEFDMLGTLRRAQLPVKMVLLDNQRMGLVRQSQELFFDGRFSETILTDNPDFVCMASAFGIPGENITRKEEVIPALQRLLASPTAYLLHVSIASEDNVWPLVPPGAANEQMLEANS